MSIFPQSIVEVYGCFLDIALHIFVNLAAFAFDRPLEPPSTRDRNNPSLWRKLLRDFWDNVIAKVRNDEERILINAAEVCFPSSLGIDDHCDHVSQVLWKQVLEQHPKVMNLVFIDRNDQDAVFPE